MKAKIAPQLMVWIAAQEHGREINAYNVKTWGDCSLATACKAVDAALKDGLLELWSKGQGSTRSVYLRTKKAAD
jgi:hypothetical protein